MNDLSILCDLEIFCYFRDRATQNVRMFSTSDEEFEPDYSLIKVENRTGPKDVQHHYQKKQDMSLSPQAHLTTAQNGDERLTVPSYVAKSPPPFSSIMYNRLMNQISFFQEAIRALRTISQNQAGGLLTSCIPPH